MTTTMDLLLSTPNVRFDPNDAPAPEQDEPGEDPGTPGSGGGIKPRTYGTPTPVWTVGQQVLRYRDHHDKTPRTETVARVMKRYVVLENGEKFGVDGAEWGNSKAWFHTRIEPLPKEQPGATLESAVSDTAPNGPECPSTGLPGAADADSPSASDPYTCHVCGNPTSNRYGWCGCDYARGELPPPFTRTPAHDVPNHEAWRCEEAHVFWVEVGHRPLTCPLCEHGQMETPSAPDVPMILPLIRMLLDEWKELDSPTPYDSALAHLQRTVLRESLSAVEPRCTLCGGPHRTSACPQIGDERQRQEEETSRGRGIWEAYLEDRAAFLRLIQWATAERLVKMSTAVAFYLSHRWGHPITGYQVLKCWNAAPARG